MCRQILDMRLWACSRLGRTARTCSRAAMASACAKFFAGLHRIHADAKCPSGKLGSSAKGVRQGKIRIVLEGRGQMTDGAFKRFSSVRVTLPKAGHELVIRLRVAAVAV